MFIGNGREPSSKVNVVKTQKISNFGLTYELKQIVTNTKSSITFFKSCLRYSVCVPYALTTPAVVTCYS